MQSLSRELTHPDLYFRKQISLQISPCMMFMSKPLPARTSFPTHSTLLLHPHIFAPSLLSLTVPGTSSTLHEGPEWRSHAPIQLTEKSPHSGHERATFISHGQAWFCHMLNMKAHMRQVPVTEELCAFVHREQGESQSRFQRQSPFKLSWDHRLRKLWFVPSSKGLSPRGGWGTSALHLWMCCWGQEGEDGLPCHYSGGSGELSTGGKYMTLRINKLTLGGQWQGRTAVFIAIEPSPFTIAIIMGRSTLLKASSQGSLWAEGKAFGIDWTFQRQIYFVWTNRGELVAGTPSLLALVGLPGSRMVESKMVRGLVPGMRGC